MDGASGKLPPVVVVVVSAAGHRKFNRNPVAVIACWLPASFDYD